MELGIEFLSVFGLPPVEFVNLAADLGCPHISTGLSNAPYDPPFYPPFSLRDDAALRREMIAAMQHRGVAISLGEGLNIRPQQDIRDVASDLDLMAELGVPRVNSVSLDPDRGRSFDQFGVLAELAGERDMDLTVEPSPGLTVGDLDAGLAAIAHVGRSNFRLLIDTMHLVRSGSSPADLAAVDPGLIGYFQLSDAPLTPVIANYGQEAMFERMVPGEGELPLREILAVVPAGVVVGLEVPIRSLADAGVGPHERLGRCVQAARTLMA
jgi:sugar phosphate isomerase/epimerase